MEDILEIQKPKQKEFSLRNITWGSPEFYKIIDEANKQELEQELYERTIEAIRIIKEGI
jgi:hypothetical protein